MELSQLRLENSKYRNACRERVTRSKLPKELKATLQVIISYIGSASNYTLSWVSAETIAKTTGTNTRTIERHIHILQKVGLINREKLSVADTRKLLKERFDYNLKVSSPNTWFMGLTTINRDHGFWQDGPIDGLLAEIKKVAHAARVGGRKAALDAEHTVTSDTNIPSRVTRTIPSPETPNIPSPVPEKPSYPEQELLIPATPEPAQGAAPPEQSDAKGVRRGSHQPEPSSDAGKGGFDFNEELDSPKPTALEGVAGSHPLQGPVDPVGSVTPQESESPLPAEEGDLSASDDETVPEDAPSSATEVGSLESKAVPAGVEPAAVSGSTEEEDDGFLAGDGSLDFLLSHLDEE